MINIVKCKKPKGYYPTNLYFLNKLNADEFIKRKRNDDIKIIEKKLKNNLSKMKYNKIKKTLPSKYILTKKGNKFLLWKQIQ